MVCCRTTRKTSSGFTLLELVIAINLLVILVALVYNEIHTASRSWDAVASESEGSDELRVAYRFIRQRLGQARPLSITDRDGRRVAFVGGPRLVHFTAPAPKQRGNAGGLYLYTLAIAGEPGKGRLEVSYAPYLPDAQGFPPQDPDTISVLAEDMAEGEISYFGADGTGGEKQWQDHWDRRDLLPELVRFRLSGQGRAGVWPDLVVALKSRQAGAAPR